LTKLSRTGDHLWSTYLGGTGGDEAWDVALDHTANAYVTGYTSSTVWVSGGFDTVLHGVEAGFVAKLSTNGEHLWSTYLGGSRGAHGFGIVINALNDVFVAGDTDLPDWTSGGFDLHFHGGPADAFVAKLTGTGQHLWSSYLGGDDHDNAYDIELDESGGVYLAGFTESAGWTSDGFDTQFHGDYDTFIARIADAPIAVTIPRETTTIQQGATVNVAWTADSPVTGSAYFVALQAADHSMPLIKISSDLWKPDHLENWETSMSIPNRVPAGNYRLVVVSIWLLEHPELRPQGCYYGESAATLIIQDRNAVPPSDWKVYP
jgi:hypothetical protein